MHKTRPTFFSSPPAQGAALRDDALLADTVPSPSDFVVYMQQAHRQGGSKKRSREAAATAAAPPPRARTPPRSPPASDLTHTLLPGYASGRARPRWCRHRCWRQRRRRRVGL